MKRSLLLCISFILALTAPILHAVEAAKPSGQTTILQGILILNSYHPGYAWSDQEQAGIIDVFRAKDKTFIPVIEYLDLQRLPAGKHLAELKKLFRIKYQNQRFSVVIALDNPALEFAIDNQEELFRNVPIVFCGINNYTPSLLKGHTNVTGIVESIDLAETIKVMLRLHPDAREILVIHDHTDTGLEGKKEIEALAPRFVAQVRFRFLDRLSIDEVLKKLESLPNNSLVLLRAFNTDKTGHTFGLIETTRLFTKHSPVPVYAAHEQRLGFGIVGGKLLSPQIQGNDAARITLRLLVGEKASAIPVDLQSDSKFMFDYKVMKRFGIPLSALPKASTVINKPVSFYAAHRVVIQTALGVIVFMTVVISLLTINITHRRRFTITLRQKEANFRRSLDDSPLGVRVTTSDGETIYTNQTILDIYGYDSIEELNTTPVKKRYTTESYAEFQIRREKRKLGDYSPSEYEVSIVKKDGGVRHLQVFRKEILWNGERQFQVTYNDITERKKAEEALKASEKRFRDLVEHLNDVHYELDEQGIIQYTSPSVEHLLGYCQEETIGRSIKDFMDTQDITRATENIQSAMYSEIGPQEYRIRNKSLEPRWIRVLSSPIRKGDKVVGIRGILSDITERKKAEETLRKSEQRFRDLSIIDNLTQLYNARHFYHQLKIESNRVNRYGQPLTLMLIDIDDFKGFNDAYGHIEGDQVLLRLGQVIKRCLRQTDSAYRYGGEEFTIILPMTTVSDGAVIAERIRAELKKQHFSPAPGQDVHVTVSIGIAQYKPQEDIKIFIHRVDQLMYQGKKNGKDEICSEL